MSDSQNNNFQNEDADELGIKFEHSDGVQESDDSQELSGGLSDDSSSSTEESEEPSDLSDLSDGITSDLDADVPISKPKLPETGEEVGAAEFGEYGQIKSEVVLDLDDESSLDDSEDTK